MNPRAPVSESGTLLAKLLGVPKLFIRCCYNPYGPRQCQWNVTFNFLSNILKPSVSGSSFSSGLVNEEENDVNESDIEMRKWV